MTEPGIRHAASVILWRGGAEGPEVLMGQRGAGAVFMPMKHVFPGGAVDPVDAATRTAAGTVGSVCARRLTLWCAPDAPGPDAIAAAALRELTEETGLRLGGDVPAGSLRFVFRAITPPSRTRRFDARFLLADARCIDGDANDFSAAGGELSRLHWVPLARTHRLDLPFVTGIVAAEVGAVLLGDRDRGVPFFDNSGDVPTFRRLD